MKQIKTIYEGDPKKFDDKVNAAISEGWSLEKRTLNQYGFIAELEREIITDAEQTCENCRYPRTLPGAEPCLHCDPGTNWKWEAAE